MQETLTNGVPFNTENAGKSCAVQCRKRDKRVCRWRRRGADVSHFCGNPHRLKLPCQTSTKSEEFAPCHSAQLPEIISMPTGHNLRRSSGIRSGYDCPHSAACLQTATNRPRIDARAKTILISSFYYRSILTRHQADYTFGPAVHH